jgi:glycosyltransferase involved in cell wall biosynthesis
MLQSSLIQVLILTKNEEPNLKRVLDKLTLFEKVLVLDSFSTDATLEIAKTYSNTVVYQRQFDTHASQWNYGLSLIDSSWILSLDSDYVLTDAFIQELKQFVLQKEKVAYFTKFNFLVFGKPLRNDNTTARPVLFMKEFASYFDDGHSQRLTIKGETGAFKSVILHDDRKSLSRWFSNQDGYAIKEVDKLKKITNEPLPMSGKIRKTKIFAPFIVFFYSLFIQGLILDGWRGWHYTLQRTMVEIMFALRLIEEENLKNDIPKDL